MSVAKNPAIAALDPGSLCHSIYTELYGQFFNAQDRKDDARPWGVEEGDDTSLRLHNAAYGFAAAISGAMEGGGGSGSEGILLDYLKKSGGDMAGPLRADYGFTAGKGNTRVLETYSYDDGKAAGAGIRIHGELDMGSAPLLFGGQTVISHDGGTSTTYISSSIVDFTHSSVRIGGEIIVGSKAVGLYAAPDVILFKGHHIYHQGNANLETVDWTMRDAAVRGALDVSGQVSVSGKLTALNGVELGNDGKGMLYLTDGDIRAQADLSFAAGYGIRISSLPVLMRSGEKDILLSGIGGDLLLGGGETNKIKLLTGLMDADGDYTLLSPHGAAYFPDSLTVRHNFGKDLLSSYRASTDDEGIVIHETLRFGTAKGVSLKSADRHLQFQSYYIWYGGTGGTPITPNRKATVGFELSTSYFKTNHNYTLGSLVIDTDADSVRFDKPLEAKIRIGIDSSYTRLIDGALYLGSDTYLLGVKDGVKHYGNSYMLGDVSSELFSPGFAGSGWAIQKNGTTGNATATVDELTVRKRMRVYELEVKKTSATNGALWISDSFSGDTVERVY